MALTDDERAELRAQGQAWRERADRYLALAQRAWPEVPLRLEHNKLGDVPEWEIWEILREETHFREAEEDILFRHSDEVRFEAALKAMAGG